MLITLCVFSVLSLLYNHLQRSMDAFTYLTRGQYPMFNKYPKFIVDYQVQERERIRQEEMDYLRQRFVKYTETLPLNKIASNLSPHSESCTPWFVFNCSFTCILM